MYVILRKEQQQIVLEDGTVITLVKARSGKASLGVETPAGKRVFQGGIVSIPHYYDCEKQWFQWTQKREQTFSEHKVGALTR